jgi:hypothetical protein
MNPVLGIHSHNISTQDVGSSPSQQFVSKGGQTTVMDQLKSELMINNLQSRGGGGGGTVGSTFYRDSSRKRQSFDGKR